MICFKVLIAYCCKWDKIFICLIFYSLCFCLKTFGGDKIIPFSAKGSLTTEPSYINLLHSNKAKLNRRKSDDNLKAFTFADLFETQLTPANSGNWEITKDGKVWRLGIYSPMAYSLYLSFSSIELSPGVSLFVYRENYEQLQGAFNCLNTSSKSSFSVAPVAGERIIIELNVPLNADSFGNIEISKIFHDKINLFGNITKTGDKAFSTSCDQNINCINGTFWQTEKRSVCKIITDGALCTGTLLANASHSNDPYVLTAYHTIFDQKHAEEAIFIFNDEFQDCDLVAVTAMQVIYGANLLATAEKLDHSLLKLNQVPPVSFKPYYAGWDLGDTPFLPVTSIHHPLGKPKQIAVSYQHCASSDFEAAYAPNSFWKVGWDVGTTEPGSSGAPLFNKQHRIIGLLTGGSSSCGVSGFDYYNKLSSSWGNLPGMGTALKEWLDPYGTGLTTLDGYDPHGFDTSNCSVSWNIKATEAKEVSFLTEKVGVGDGFAEKFLSPGSILIPVVFLNVAQLFSGSPLDRIQLRVWNGEETPEREIYSQTVFLKDLTLGVNKILLDSTIKTIGNVFIGYQPEIGSSSQFKLYQARNRGKNEASSTLFSINGEWIDINHFDNQLSTSLAIGFSSCYGIAYPASVPVLKLYPNPCKTYLTLLIPDNSLPIEVSGFDVNGHAISLRYSPNEFGHTVYFNVPAGIYFLRVKTYKNTFISKFVVSQ